MSDAPRYKALIEAQHKPAHVRRARPKRFSGIYAGCNPGDLPHMSLTITVNDLEAGKFATRCTLYVTVPGGAPSMRDDRKHAHAELDATLDELAKLTDGHRAAAGGKEVAS